jgi:hypothetical protein
MENWDYDWKIWHWTRNDDPTTNTFGLLTLSDRFENKLYQSYDNKNILSKDETLLFTFTPYETSKNLLF